MMTSDVVLVLLVIAALALAIQSLRRPHMPPPPPTRRPPEPEAAIDAAPSRRTAPDDTPTTTRRAEPAGVHVQVQRALTPVTLNAAPPDGYMVVERVVITRVADDPSVTPDAPMVVTILAPT